MPKYPLPQLGTSYNSEASVIDQRSRVFEHRRKTLTNENEKVQNQIVDYYCRRQMARIENGNFFSKVNNRMKFQIRWLPHVATSSLHAAEALCRNAAVVDPKLGEALGVKLAN